METGERSDAVNVGTEDVAHPPWKTWQAGLQRRGLHCRSSQRGSHRWELVQPSCRLHSASPPLQSSTRECCGQSKQQQR